jgi:ribosomal protein S18 acetylase RimI-like enzyme
MRHPEHEALAKTVRGWYLEPAPEMGYTIEKRRFGYYMRNAGAPHFGRVTIEGLNRDEVPRFLADAHDYFGDASVELCVEDGATDDRLRDALLAGGVERNIANVYLAHVGPLPDAPDVPGLTVERADPTTIETYARTKLMAFSSSEVPPAETRVAEETRHRRTELGGSGSFQVARVDGEPAAVIGWYEEPKDRFVFQLGTRVPFRMRGVARRLLCDAVAEGYDRGCRSVLLNTDVDDTPIRLYRRMGFTDEVYWTQEYILNPRG